MTIQEIKRFSSTLRTLWPRPWVFLTQYLDKQSGIEWAEKLEGSSLKDLLPIDSLGEKAGLPGADLDCIKASTSGETVKSS